MQQNNSGQRPHGKKNYFVRKKKFCLFCKDRVRLVDYKNAKLLEKFVMETGKILPARVSGTCPYHQKQLTKAIKRARHMAILKFVEQKRG